MISQFEKPEDDKTRNIYTQNHEMLRNQLAFTEGVRGKQRALTEGFNQFERLADMRELPDDPWNRDWVPERRDGGGDEQQRRVVRELKLERNIEGNDLNILRASGYPRSNDFYHTNIQNLEQVLVDVNSDIRILTGQINGRNRTLNPSPEYVAETNQAKAKKGSI